MYTLHFMYACTLLTFYIKPSKNPLQEMFVCTVLQPTLREKNYHPNISIFDFLKFIGT